MDRIGLSMVICTYNRAPFLRELLSSIERELTDRLDFEVIVVDNNCADDTPMVASEFSDRLPNFRRVVEVNQGLSFARNRGAAEATKEYLLYIDDDAILSDGFLYRAEVVLRRFKPDIFGGPVLPRYDRVAPPWFDVDSEIRQFERFSGFSANGSVSGGNFGIRRSLVEELGKFDTSLGMTGEKMAFGEDREMVERYRASRPKAEHRLYYAVEMPILHYTMPYKYDQRYQWDRKYRNALSQQKTFIKTGKRKILQSMAYAIGHILLFPVVAIKTIRQTGLSSYSKFLIIRHAYGLAGQIRGIVEVTTWKIRPLGSPERVAKALASRLGKNTDTPAPRNASRPRDRGREPGLQDGQIASEKKGPS